MTSSSSTNHNFEIEHDKIIIEKTKSCSIEPAETFNTSFSTFSSLLSVAMAVPPVERRVLVRNVKFSATKAEFREVAEAFGATQIIDIKMTWKPLADGNFPTYKTAFCKVPNESWMNSSSFQFYVFFKKNML